MADVSIKVDDEDITDIVIFESANFTTMVNGRPGTAAFRVRDNPHNYEIVTGRRLHLDIDDDRVWTGYVMGASRTFALPVMPTGPQYPRLFSIDAVDINILFKRIVFDQSNHRNMYGPTYPAHTSDITALTELLGGDWLDLEGDDLDVSSMIEHVADINVDQPAYPWNPAQMLGVAMDQIAKLPGAIYYIDPDRRLVYTDVDTPNAPYGMSDRPGPGQVGYRELQILKDGSKLINDYLAVGFGYGDSDEVVVRLQDAPSIAAHGRWQAATTAYGVYKQATINRVADSIVYGSPQNKRGAKDDRVSAELVTYTSGFRAAQKVALESEAFNFNDVIPIRKLEITFPVPFDPRYKLSLSHELDPPFGFIDNLPRPRPSYPVDDDDDDDCPDWDPDCGPGDGDGDGGDPLPGKPYYNIDSGEMDESAGILEGVWLSQPVRGDEAGPRVWWLKGGHGIFWDTVPPIETSPASFAGFQATAPIQMFAQIRGQISAATVTAGDTHLKVELVAIPAGEDVEQPDEENGGEVIATADSPNSSGGLRFFGDSLYFEFNNVFIDYGMQFRLNCGIQGLVLIGGPSGRIGFFQPGWMEAHRTANAGFPSEGERTEQYAGDGSSTSFTTAEEFAAVMSVTINGHEQTDYTTDHANHTIHFDFAPAPDDRIEIKYLMMK